MSTDRRIHGEAEELPQMHVAQMQWVDAEIGLYAWRADDTLTIVDANLKEGVRYPIDWYGKAALLVKADGRIQIYERP